MFERFTTALERDRTKTRVSEISQLGLVEMTRKNVSDGFWGVLTRPCPVCGGQGRVLSDQTRIITVERRMREILASGRNDAYLFGANPEVLAMLMDPGSNTLARLRSESGKKVVVVADDTCGPVDVRVLIEGDAGA